MSGFDAALDFGDPPAASPRRSWRNPVLSDWQLQLGEAVYSVHRADLCEGDRGSEFFLALFQRWGDSGTSKTDLTSLLPKLCWPVFEQVLDFVYTGAVSLCSSTAVLLFKIGHVLRMRMLCEVTVAYLKSNLSAATAFTVLQHSLELSPGLEGFAREAISTIASNFSTYAPEAFDAVSPEAVLQILLHDSLCATAPRISAVVTSIIRQRMCNRDSLLHDLARFVRVVHSKDTVFWIVASELFQIPHLYKQCWSRLRPADWPVADLLLLSHEEVVKLFDRDDLAIESEDQVYEMIASYVDSRQLSPEGAASVWWTCRFVHLSIEKLCNDSLRQLGIPHEAVKAALAARALLHEKGQEAMSAFLEGQVVADLGCDTRRFDKRRGPRKRPRLSHTCFLHSAPFDHGVLYHIGTAAGAKAWSNPCASKNVIVTCSSLSSVASSSPKVCKDGFVSRPDSGDDTSFVSEGEETAWIEVDLGKDRRLLITGYCLRSGVGLQSKLRHWDFEGADSSSGAWTILRRHRHDKSLANGHHTVAAWSIENAHRSFRVFRITNRGPNAHGSFGLRCSGIELYGELTET